MKGAARHMAEKLKSLGAEALEADAADLEFLDGALVVAGTDRRLTLAELANHPAATAEHLSATDAFSASEATYPNGTHACEVEIDPDTGSVEILRYVVVDDFGVTLNPLLLAGQVHGGIVQGVGQALHERTVYDEDGQLLTASFMDYALAARSGPPGHPFRDPQRALPYQSTGREGRGRGGRHRLVPGSHERSGGRAGAGLRRLTHIDMPATPLAVFRRHYERTAGNLTQRSRFPGRNVPADGKGKTTCNSCGMICVFTITLSRVVAKADVTVICAV